MTTAAFLFILARSVFSVNYLRNTFLYGSLWCYVTWPSPDSSLSRSPLLSWCEPVPTGDSSSYRLLLSWWQIEIFINSNIRSESRLREHSFWLQKGILAFLSAGIILNGYENQKMWNYVSFCCLLIKKRRRPLLRSSVAGGFAFLSAVGAQVPISALLPFPLPSFFRIVTFTMWDLRHLRLVLTGNQSAGLYQ